MILMYNTGNFFSEDNMYFGGKSYLKIKRPDHMRKGGTFKFIIKPDYPTGVIMYGFGKVSSTGQDHIAISLVNGYVEFR